MSCGSCDLKKKLKICSDEDDMMCHPDVVVQAVANKSFEFGLFLAS